MFERYNEKARRTIFFAHYEASQFGSPYIESEHMLLGLLHEDKTLTMRFITPRTTEEALRKEIEQQQTVRESIPTSVDLPLSNECKHILAYAAEESERLAHEAIGTEHLFLGILREKHCFAAELLKQHGINVGEMRIEMEAGPPPSPAPRAPRATSIVGYFELVLKVANLQASVDFYTKLGLDPTDTGGPGTALLRNGNCFLKLDQNPVADQLVCFRSADFSSTLSLLQSAGIQLEQAPRTGADGTTTVLLRDPDGHIISLSSQPLRATSTVPPK